MEIEIERPSDSVIAAAVGWLAGRAFVLLGDRTFQHRATAALTDHPSKISLEFLTAFDTDIQWACKRAKVRPPRLSQFFEGPRLIRTTGTDAPSCGILLAGR